MTYYLCRHPAESNSNESKVEAEKLWQNWFTVNGVTRNEFVSANHKEQNTTEQPTRTKLVKPSELTSASERRKIANESSGENERKTNKWTIKHIASAK